MSARALPVTEPGGCPDPAVAVLSTVPSDAHTWNLIFLERLLTETGFHVHNLGPCVPEDLLVDSCRRLRPDLLVVSSVNGHGATEGERAVRRLRAVPELAALPAVIGGKLDTRGQAAAPQVRRRLLAAGFDEVHDGAASLASFQSFARRARDARHRAGVPR